MKAFIQRVSQASVCVSDVLISEIGYGFLILLGVEEGDVESDIKCLAKKTVQLRVFDDDAGKLNLSLLDVGAEVLVVSQFTLCGDAKKGNRPSFVKAMEPIKARCYVDKFCEEVISYGVKVKQGQFGAMMKVNLINDGPVSLMLESRNGVMV